MFKKIKIISANHQFITIFISILVILGAMALVMFNINRSSNVNLESKMTSLTKEYYEKMVKGKVTGIDKYVVSIDDMEKAKLDISDLISKEANCDKESYSYVIIKNSKEIDKSKIKYTIENHLNCGNNKKAN